MDKSKFFNIIDRMSDYVALDQKIASLAQTHIYQVLVKNGALEKPAAKIAAVMILSTNSDLMKFDAEIWTKFTNEVLYPSLIICKNTYSKNEFTKYLSIDDALILTAKRLDIELYNQIKKES